MKIKLFIKNILTAFLWFIWDFSGLRYIWSKIVPPMPDREKQQRRPSTFILWVVGIYIALFGVASNRYENRVDIIENRINAIYAQLSKDEQIAFERIPYVQNLLCPYKPNLFTPLSVIKSFKFVVTYENYEKLTKKNKNSKIATWFLKYFYLVDIIYEDGTEQLKELFEDYFKKTKVISDKNGKKKRVSKLLGYYLGGIYLKNANLWGANLENAKLMQANLENAKLMQANLENAFLNEANLENATLVTTNLKNAYLEGANLENATLKEANLEKANFNEANLENAWLEKANLENALLCNANLKNIRDITAERLSKAFSLWGVKNLDSKLKQDVEKINPKLFEPNYKIKECNDKGKGSYWLEYLEQQKNKK